MKGKARRSAALASLGKGSTRPSSPASNATSQTRNGMTMKREGARSTPANGTGSRPTSDHTSPKDRHEHDTGGSQNRSVRRLSPTLQEKGRRQNQDGEAGEPDVHVVLPPPRSAGHPAGNRRRAHERADQRRHGAISGGELALLAPQRVGGRHPPPCRQKAGGERAEREAREQTPPEQGGEKKEQQAPDGDVKGTIREQQTDEQRRPQRAGDIGARSQPRALREPQNRGQAQWKQEVPGPLEMPDGKMRRDVPVQAEEDEEERDGDQSGGESLRQEHHPGEAGGVEEQRVAEDEGGGIDPPQRHDVGSENDLRISQQILRTLEVRLAPAPRKAGRPRRLRQRAQIGALLHPVVRGQWAPAEVEEIGPVGGAEYEQRRQQAGADAPLPPSFRPAEEQPVGNLRNRVPAHRLRPRRRTSPRPGERRVVNQPRLP